ncbi:MAG: membrane protein insertion efficiency factor YidD [Helicobacter sp.]|nr:membrane protein insertion efficiency factor YidD [Helicobacter sp.]
MSLASRLPCLLRRAFARVCSAFRAGICRLLRAYQLFVSPMFFGASCRYYPSCSQYALWLFGANASMLLASVCVLTRIVRCNPFSAGGIDYPIVWHSPHALLPKPCFAHKPVAVRFWLVPRKAFLGFHSFYLIKSQYEGKLCV